jgi:hypothetical protein
MCARLVQPWLYKWLADFDFNGLDFETNPSPEQCLFVYWTFGLSQRFLRLAGKRVMNMKIQDSQALAFDNRFVEEKSAPPGIIGTYRIIPSAPVQVLY